MPDRTQFMYVKSSVCVQMISLLQAEKLGWAEQSDPKRKGLVKEIKKKVSLKGSLLLAWPPWSWGEPLDAASQPAISALLGQGL